jgi:hypothetical protein
MIPASYSLTGVELWFRKTLLRKMVNPRYERASRYHWASFGFGFFFLKERGSPKKWAQLDF